MKIPCKDCGGKGHVTLLMFVETCTTCEGLGVVPDKATIPRTPRHESADGRRAEYFEPGMYRVRVKSDELITARTGRVLRVVHTTVLASNTSIRVGDERTWICVVSQDGDTHPTVGDRDYEQFLRAVDPSTLEVDLRVFERVTKFRHKVFLSHVWSRPVP